MVNADSSSALLLVREHVKTDSSIVLTRTSSEKNEDILFFKKSNPIQKRKEMSQTLHPSIIDNPTLGNVAAPHKATTVSFSLLVDLIKRGLVCLLFLYNH